MTKKDEFLYAHICQMADHMDDTQDCVTGLMWLALNIACKRAQEERKGDDKICDHCLLKYFNCLDIYSFCQCNGVSLGEEDFKQELISRREESDK